MLDYQGNSLNAEFLSTCDWLVLFVAYVGSFARVQPGNWASDSHRCNICVPLSLRTPDRRLCFPQSSVQIQLRNFSSLIGINPRGGGGVYTPKINGKM